MAETNFENATLKLLIEDTDGIVTVASLQQTPATPSGGGTPGGSDTQVQFNDGDSFGGNTALTFDKTNQLLVVKAKHNAQDNSIEVVDEDGEIRVGLLGSNFNGNASVYARGGDGTYGAELTAAFNDATVFVFKNPFGAISLGGTGRIFQNLSEDGLSAINIQRFTDTSPTGNFIVCNDGGGNPVFSVDINGVLCLTPRADPASPTEGMVWAGTDHHLYYYNGTTKKQLDN